MGLERCEPSECVTLRNRNAVLQTQTQKRKSKKIQKEKIRSVQTQSENYSKNDDQSAPCTTRCTGLPTWHAAHCLCVMLLLQSQYVHRHTKEEIKKEKPFVLKLWLVLAHKCINCGSSLLFLCLLRLDFFSSHFFFAKYVRCTHAKNKKMGIYDIKMPTVIINTAPRTNAIFEYLFLCVFIWLLFIVFFLFFAHMICARRYVFVIIIFVVHKKWWNKKKYSCGHNTILNILLIHTQNRGERITCPHRWTLATIFLKAVLILTEWFVDYFTK